MKAPGAQAAASCGCGLPRVTPLLLVALLAALAWSAVRLVLRFPRGEIGPAAGAIGVLIAGVLIGGTQSGLLSIGNIAAASVWICVLTLPVLARESRP